MEKRNQAAKLIVGAVVVIIAVLALAGIVSQHDIMYKSTPLNRDDISYKEVAAPEASGYDGTVTADDWKAIYPDIVLTMGRNTENDNSEGEDYLDLDPYLKDIYDGFGFADMYEGARGHAYTLDDVDRTVRSHPLANCLTCKTPNFTKLVQDKGVEAYKYQFKDVMKVIRENGGEAISCYNCHGNNAGNRGEIVITHTYVEKALGENMDKIDLSTLSCGQCHIEYYFDKTTSETSMPYRSVEEMTPEAIYEFYQNMVLPDGTVGFYDWEQKSTGTKMLKVQHPEMETYLLGVHASELNCADCHMPVVQNDKTQEIYHSHLIVSPLEDKTLLQNCLVCHKDLGVKNTDEMITFVTNIQTRIKAEESRVGNLLAEFKKALEAKNTAGTLTDEQLDPIREIYRKAQWFFDFCYVENAEGAHNSALADRCLSTAEALINQGMAELSALDE